MKGFVLCFALSLVFLAALPMADIIISATRLFRCGNSFPFGSAYNAEYQQV